MTGYRAAQYPMHTELVMGYWCNRNQNTNPNLDPDHNPIPNPTDGRILPYVLRNVS